MKTINKIIRIGLVGAALAVVFAFASPAMVAKADGYGGRGSYNSRYTSTYSAPSHGYGNYGVNSNYGGDRNYGGGYSHNPPAPIVVTPPQIIYQQPQVVYQEPIVYPQPEIVYQQPQVVYEQPAVYQPTYYQSYSPLSVSCYANPASVQTGQSVTWQAYASGGTGVYDYTWSGTNGSYTSGSTNYSTYYTPGSYSASVTVYSNGQSITQSCGYVSVVDSYGYNSVPTYAYNYPTSNNGNLVAACFANRTTAAVGTPITWGVEVTGGTGQYSYSWSGSDGLTGVNASAVQSYYTTGSKNATVLISSGGQTISQACGDSVSIHSYASSATTNSKAPATTNSANPTSLSAAAALGFGYIPWGWIAILLIIVLGVTVSYLLFNRHKV